MDLKDKLIIRSRERFKKKVYYPVVYEWEEIFSGMLNAKISKLPRLLWDFTALNVVSRYNRKLIFSYELDAGIRFRRHGLQRPSRRDIPFIIDYFLPEAELPRFVEIFRDSGMLIVSSKQVEEYLAEKVPELKAVHVPLSLSDKYAPKADEVIEKDIDLAFIGRKNPIWDKWIQQYLSTHPELKVVEKRKNRNGGFVACDIHTGEEVAPLDSREDYMNLLHRTRVFPYSTPGIEGDSKSTNGFHPVTPRFLEAVASGCNILLRYSPNADTDFYELEKFGPNLRTYEEFCVAMDKALSVEPDMVFYADYMKRHSTSATVERFVELLIERNLL